MRRLSLGIGALILVCLLVASLPIPGGGVPAASASSPHPAASKLIQGLYMLNTTDPNAGPNHGASMYVTSFAMPPYRGTGFASFQLAVDELVNSSYLFVCGLEANWTLGGPTAYPFAAVIKVTGGLNGNLTTFGTGSPVPVGTLLRVYVEGSPSGVWTAYVNGDPILNYSLGAGSVSDPFDTFVTLTSSSYGVPWLPRLVSLPQALEVLNGTQWYMPQGVYADWLGSGPAPLNLSGASLNSSLFPGEFEAGTGFSSLYRGAVATEIWNQTPFLPSALQGTTSPSLAVAGTLVNVSWHVSSGGRNVPGVEVDYWSSLGGAVGTALSDAQGWANGTFVAPLVTVATPVNLTAMVLNASFFGDGNASLRIVPFGVEALTVNMNGSVLPTNASHIVSLIIQVTHNGQPVAGAMLLPASNVGGGTFLPFAPWVTNAAGMVFANYTVPQNASVVTIWANTSGALYSGGSSVEFTFHPQPATGGGSGTDTSVYLYYAIGGGVAAGILFNLGIWLYRKRQH
jgi:hypothetical protein